MRNAQNRIVGYIYMESNGDKRVTDVSGAILGWYKKAQNVTVNFSGRIVARCDASSALIPNILSSM